MKFKFLTISIIAIFTILIVTNVFAATGTVDLKSSTYEVRKGDEFTITLYASSEDGINGIDTSYTYNADKLEKISENLIDTTNWSNLGISPNISVISNSIEDIKNADIYLIKFKVKDNVSVGEKLSISTTGIFLDTNAESNSEITISPKNVQVTVVEDTLEPNNDNPNNNQNQDENEEPNNNQNQGSTEETNNNQNPKNNEQQDNNQGNNNGEGTNNSEDLGKSDNYIDEQEKDSQTQSIYTQKEDNLQVSTDKKNAEKKDTTAPVTTLPKTGINYIVIVSLAVVFIIIAIVFYKKYTYIKDIK